MAIEQVLYFPVTAVSHSGIRVPLFAPVVDSLPGFRESSVFQSGRV